MMGGEMSKILPGLFVGGWKNAQDEEQVKENGITHILFIEAHAKKGKIPGVQYMCVLLDDRPDVNISHSFAQCNDFIHEARLSGGNVLVHCIAGMSRSVTVTVAYLMTILPELDSKMALSCVRGAREIASPNPGFMKQLQEFEGRRLREERKRLQQKFNMTLCLPGDEEESKRLIQAYKERIMSKSQSGPVEEKGISA